MNYNKHLWLKITNARTAAFTMRPTQKKKDKTRPRVNSGCVASNTRSKTNKTNIGAVNVKNNRKKSKKKLQKKKTCVRKCVQDTNHIDRNGTQNIETKSDLLVVEDACATKKEIPKNSEDGSETTTPVAGISTEKIYKTEKLITKTIDAASDKKPNVRKKEPCGFIYDDSYKNLKIKQLLKIKNKKNALSNRKRLKNTKDPPGDVNNLQNNSKSNGLAEEIEDSVVDKLPNIVIQRNFSKNASGCDSKRRICKVWLTNLPDKQNNSNNSISENFPDNDVIANEIKQPPKNDFESGNSSDSGLKEEKITNIINGFIDYTNLSDVESTTTFSNLSPNSNCALCVEVPNEKNIIQKTDHGSETNPFVKYRLESCNFNIKITRTLQGVSMASASSRVCKKRWTLNHFFKLQTTIIRVTSKDSIFCDAMLEKDDAIKENKVTTKCVLDTENSQTSASSSPHNFLLPLLPPSKRPPTRRSVTITTTKNTEDCNHSKTPPPEDDVISLFACSVVSSPEMDPEYSDDNLDKNVTDSSKNIEENIIAPSTNSNYNIKEIIHSKSNSSPEKHEKEEPMHNRPPLRLMTYNYIPDIFRGVCYHYFAKKNCRRKPYCTRLHGLYPNTEESILNLSYEELQNVYNFTKGKIVYKETFPFFINAYVKHKKILDLVSIVRDAVDQDMFERSPFVEKIVEAIQSIGYSFHQAIEEIITILGITNLNICLSDILINIVVRSSANLEVDWPLIKKLTKYRTDRLDHGVVEDIIRICVKFKNVQLCLNTFRDILNTQLVNLEQLNFEFLQKFVLILRQLNFIQESKILAGKAKIPLNDDDVVNDMNDVSSEKCLKENDVYQLKENVSFKSFSEGEHMYENSYEFDELGANMSYSEAETSTPNCCDTIVPNNGAPSEVSCSSKNISAKVISSLANVIKDKDVSKFLGILEQYKSENYVESFVLNVVKLLEKEDLRDVYKMMAKLFNTISIDKYKHRFWFESHARYLIETLSFNVIALFDRTKSWKQAANIIKRFSNDYVNFTKAKTSGNIITIYWWL
ncbi:uncharacterized protein LOC108735743 isoform X2 [Agrilus planipennis]|uniref:Uncharacterized protein LOC108735743 isoform X2 n=1 Tax=Agrilus planipennis TaxID=224129 RepID=A0A7F5RG59_AGRPL|nr:uncharacterized protein LOC108735743 isoform X2 [Agrilus planipennis]